MIELTKVQKRICRYCKEHFVTRKRTQRFCSEACRYRYYRDTHIMIGNNSPTDINGNGKCAKRLRKLDKRDKRKHRKFKETSEQVRDQFGDDLWKHGIIGSTVAGKPRARKKAAVAAPEVIQ